MNTLLDLTYITLSYEEKLNTCIVDWKENFIPKGALNEFGPEIVKFIKEHRAKFLISDVTKAKLLTPDNQKYNDEVLVPNVIETGVKNIAVVLPENIFAQQNINKMMKTDTVQESDELLQVFNSRNKAQLFIEAKLNMVAL